MPRKLLLDCGDGRSILHYVYNKVSRVEWADVYIAAADDPIYFEALKFAPQDKVIPVFDTVCGTHSVYQAYINANLNYDLIINFQSDNINFKLEDLNYLYCLFRKNHPSSILTCHYKEKQVNNNPNRVKLVLGNGNRALYFSREPIPHKAQIQRIHVGVYFFWEDYLLNIGHDYIVPSINDLKSENLEQTDWLFNGYQIQSYEVQPSLSLDNWEDYEKFIKKC